MTEREKFEAYFKPIAEGMKSCGIGTVAIQRRKDQQWEGWRAAIALQQQADDGWIEWNGGKQPIADGREVAIKFRDGTVVTETLSDCWVWSHGGDYDDIIAYQVGKP